MILFSYLDPYQGIANLALRSQKFFLSLNIVLTACVCSGETKSRLAVEFLQAGPSVSIETGGNAVIINKHARITSEESL